MEFLSSQFNATSDPVFLVMQTPPKSAEKQEEDSSIQTYAIIKLPFSPTAGFHEYRFDWTPEVVTFYADGKWIQDMFYKYSPVPGHLTINHWSNGNQKWSQGPPDTNAVTTIEYVKLYYNSSSSTSRTLYETRCPDPPDEGKVCQIPDDSRRLREGFPVFFTSGTCGERNSSSGTTKDSIISTDVGNHGTTKPLTSAPVNRKSLGLLHNDSGASNLLMRSAHIDLAGFMRGLAIGIPAGILAVFGM